MSDPNPVEKSTEEQNQKINAIVSEDPLGNESARGEHSGERSADGKTAGADSLEDTLADNRPEQMK